MSVPSLCEGDTGKIENGMCVCVCVIQLRGYQENP